MQVGGACVPRLEMDRVVLSKKQDDELLMIVNGNPQNFGPVSLALRTAGL